MEKRSSLPRNLLYPKKDEDKIDTRSNAGSECPGPYNLLVQHRLSKFAKNH